MTLKTLTLLCLLSITSCVLQAQDSNEQIAEEAMNYLKENLDELDYSTCLNQTRSLLESNFRSSLSDFFNEEGVNEYINEEIKYGGSEAMRTLAEEAYNFAEFDVIRKSGVNEDDFYDCESRLIQQTYDPGESDEPGEGSLEMFMNSADFSKKDIEVSFPVYKNCTLISYLDEQQSSEMLKQIYPDIQGPFLQAAIYVTNEDFDEIVAFYQNELEDFYRGDVDTGTIAFSSEVFDFSTFLSIDGAMKWAVIESIWIEKLKSPMSNGDVKIEIHWR